MKIFIYIIIHFVVFLNACTPGNEDEEKTPPTGEISFDDYVDPDYATTRKERLGQTPMIVAYVTEYSTLPDPTCLTHINYAHGRFVNPSTGDGGIDIAKPELLKQVVALKIQKPTLKVLLMIGGWGTKADGFSQMARDSQKRLTFAEDCKKIIDEYNIDGFDIDWEYPTSSSSGIQSTSADTENFTLLMRDIRRKIGTSKLLTFASSANAKYIDFAGVKKYIDYVNVMTYDMGKPPYHNSPLYHSDRTKSISAEESVDKHIAAGIPADWLNLGIPFYGHGNETNFDADVKYNVMAGIFNSGNYIRKWDEVAKVPYLTDDLEQMLLTYDDAESIGYKCNFIKTKGMLGAMFWEYSMMTQKEPCEKPYIMDCIPQINSSLREKIYVKIRIITKI